MKEPAVLHTRPDIADCVEKWQWLRLFWIFTVLFISYFAGQAQTTSISIKASATVIDKKEIELITLNDLQIDESMADNGIIFVSSKLDAHAGKMLVKGRSGDQVLLNFQQELILYNTTGNGTLLFTYNICGYNADNQRAAEIYNTGEQKVTLSQTGEFYIWIGGRIDISSALPGHYDGEFTIEIEYVE
ncbi:MAG TPA: hypothetical protein P5338_03200 [Bacteroidales bacterium]|nr:hypothetical protein [Bacteroidales bacterium]